MMIGQLKQRLVLQEKAMVPDAGGGFAESWTDVTMHPAVFAKIDQLGASYGIYARQKVSNVTHRIILRYRGDITPQMRLIEGDKVYTIISVRDPDSRQAYLEVLAQRNNLDVV